MGSGSLPKSGGITNGLFFSTKNSSAEDFFFNVRASLTPPHAGKSKINPKGDHAARLIQEAGLKGYRIGGGKISEKHANFIINEGDALASDIESLIVHVQKEILQKFNIKLQCEVRIVGNK